MAKRFTDTLIWEKEWFMKLSPKHKCLIRYLFDRCDSSGVWEPNWTLASIYIGEKCDNSDLLVLNDHIEKLPNGKILISDFISFQYGKLSEKCAAHIPIFKAIEKNRLSLDRVSNRVYYTLKEKETEEEEEKEEETEKGVQGENIETNLSTALDDRYLEDQAMKWKHLDFNLEVLSFKEKVRGSPDHYRNHEVSGLRLAFQSQLRNAKHKPKHGLDKIIDHTNKRNALIDAKFAAQNAG